MLNKIAIVGSGNIAFHLSAIFTKRSITVSCIASRNKINANEIASRINAKVCDIEALDKSVDLVIIAVSDDAIEEVINKIPKGDFIVAHTTGSVSMKVFKNKFDKYGVFYPLQSFLKSRKVDFSNIPILVEANTEKTNQKLAELGMRISDKVEIMDSEKRKMLHLSAVIINNFVNFLASKSYGFLEENNIDSSLLQPLMLETVNRLNNNSPHEMQTGPAKRNDEKTIKKHIDQLKSNPKLQSLYKQLSKQITEEYYGR